MSMLCLTFKTSFIIAWNCNRKRNPENVLILNVLNLILIGKASPKKYQTPNIWLINNDVKCS